MSRVHVTEQPEDFDPRDWLLALIEGSDDAIISKDLSGRIKSWNGGASRIFGYAPEEVIGKPIAILIPEDRLEEEPRILARISAGQRVDHFETVRRRKDGSEVPLSLTISPIRNSSGAIVGASKIGRDISEKRIAEKRLHLLVGEMQHRIKNLFSLAHAIVSLSARSCATPEDVVSTIRARMSALARAHELTFANWKGETAKDVPVDLLPLIQTILEPYRDGDCITVTGSAAQIGSSRASSLALLVHELATNAAKYGALSVAKGRLSVRVEYQSGMVVIKWEETGGPEPQEPITFGFGSQLEAALIGALEGDIAREWNAAGLQATITFPDSNTTLPPTESERNLSRL